MGFGVQNFIYNFNTVGNSICIRTLLNLVLNMPPTPKVHKKKNKNLSIMFVAVVFGTLPEKKKGYNYKWEDLGSLCSIKMFFNLLDHTVLPLAGFGLQLVFFSSQTCVHVILLFFNMANSDHAFSTTFV